MFTAELSKACSKRSADCRAELKSISPDCGIASHAVVFRGLVLPPPHKGGRGRAGRGNTIPLKMTAWEATVARQWFKRRT